VIARVGSSGGTGRSKGPPLAFFTRKPSTSDSEYRTIRPILMKRGPRPSRRQRRNAALVHLRILDTSVSVSNCILPSPIDGSITTDTLPLEIWISAASSTKIRCLEAGMNAEARPATWSFPAARGSDFYQLQKRARSESLVAVPSRIMTLLGVVNFTDDKKQFAAPGWFRTSRQAVLRTAPSSSPQRCRQARGQPPWM
jgi:hypothetical protein